MKMVFDMSTGEVLEDCQTVLSQSRPGIATAYSLPELRLQVIPDDSREEKQMPTELVTADLNAFLTNMS